jgi:hypothetical protein
MYEVVPQEDFLRGVTPAKAGVQKVSPRQHWIPAFAGMTKVSYFIGSKQ